MFLFKLDDRFDNSYLFNSTDKLNICIGGGLTLDIYCSTLQCASLWTGFTVDRNFVSRRVSVYVTSGPQERRHISQLVPTGSPPLVAIKQPESAF